ncbi:hypothetical protein [Thermomonospora sp. CIF 1]|uniref:hypothetical protein n=1 Tax=Thermomonospora sp. CIF 1 TaxID=1916083 RepID=UPI00257E9F17|nr:hypothetical protein [Thermomonospora sp. CIF 1]
MLLVLGPIVPAAAGPFGSDPCRPADNPAPEMYGAGYEGLIKPPSYPSEELKRTPPEQLTYYDRYGTAGQFWYAVDMGCSDAMDMMGNALANTTFTLARVIDRTTITVYQAAASESLLGWLKSTVDDVISGMGKTFNARYWSWVVILGAIWRGHHLDGRRHGRADRPAPPTSPRWGPRCRRPPAPPSTRHCRRPTTRARPASPRPPARTRWTRRMSMPPPCGSRWSASPG